MWVLSRRKLCLAEALGSRALRADGVGLLAQLMLDAWWVDAVTSVAILWFLIREGREAWSGDKCCDD
jgi:hypothetical protein